MLYYYIEDVLIEFSGKIFGMYKWINFGWQCIDFLCKILRNNKSIFVIVEV